MSRESDELMAGLKAIDVALDKKLAQLAKADTLAREVEDYCERGMQYDGRFFRGILLALFEYRGDAASDSLKEWAGRIERIPAGSREP